MKTKKLHTHTQQIWMVNFKCHILLLEYTATQGRIKIYRGPKNLKDFGVPIYIYNSKYKQ